MRKAIIILFSLLVLSFSFGQELRIGVLRELKTSLLTIEKYQGNYTVYGDSSFKQSMETAKIELHSDGVKLHLPNGEHRIFSKITIVEDSTNSAVKLKSLRPASKTHYYNDNFEISNQGNRLRILNLVNMDNYLSGVVESEGGGGRDQEYYKVQALISRTYAHKNSDRHRKENFQLCDGVHCQAYHNMLRHTQSIKNAVKQTANEVLVNAKGDLVTTYFSANCGGQTCDPSYVWNNSVPYLETFIDTFCTNTRQASWTRSIDKSEWKRFIEKEYGVYESEIGAPFYNFEQTQRRAFYIHPSLGIPLRDLRTKFRLKSTFFSTHLEGNKLIVEGSGFGHGVGLCQEGAMNMAGDGFNYRQIAHFYFSNVRITEHYGDQFSSKQESFTNDRN